MGVGRSGENVFVALGLSVSYHQQGSQNKLLVCVHSRLPGISMNPGVAFLAKYIWSSREIAVHFTGSFL